MADAENPDSKSKAAPETGAPEATAEPAVAPLAVPVAGEAGASPPSDETVAATVTDSAADSKGSAPSSRGGARGSAGSRGGHSDHRGAKPGGDSPTSDRGSRNRSDRGQRSARGGRDRPGRGKEREGKAAVPDTIERLVAVNRVAKVVKGGRRFGFAAVVVVGDGKGQVGFGAGKAREVPESISKATERARQNMIRVPLREGRTLHHDVQGRFGAGKVVIRAAEPGTGIIAGGPTRAVFEALGLQDVVAKSIGSSNPYNMIRAAFQALQACQSPRQVAMRRGLKVGDLIARRAGAPKEVEAVGEVEEKA